MTTGKVRKEWRRHKVLLACGVAAIALLLWGVAKLFERDPADGTPPLSTVPTTLPNATAPPSEPPAPVMLVYKNQRLSDPQRAAIITFVATAVPVDTWKTRPVEKATTFEGIADTYYDLYARGRYASPLSTAAMIAALRQGNPTLIGTIPVQTLVNFPPLPARAKGDYRLDRGRQEDFRLFSTRTHGYSKMRDPNAMALPTETTIADVKALSAERDASATGITIDVTPELKEAIARFRDRLPALLVSTSRTAPGRNTVNTEVRIELLGAPAPPVGQPPAACPKVFDLLRASPFHAAATKSLADLPAATRAALVQLASRHRFIILDTQMARPDGHGRKVEAVAKSTLEGLGAADVAAKIQTVDLLPSTDAAAKNLDDALRTYLATKPKVAQTEIDKATKWIADQRRAAETTTWPIAFDMPDVLLQAVLWTNFIIGAEMPGTAGTKPAAKQVAWLNMSFRIKSSALSLVLPDFRRDEALAFIAAGNDIGTVVEPGWAPQDGAAGNSSFVLVTQGHVSGIEGAVSASNGPPVTLVAPGCGFEGLTDRGSSLATPYVASVAWLRHLVDLATKQPSSVAALIQDLAVASRPVPHYLGIKSGGFFDAAHLLAHPSAPHLLMTDGTTMPLQSFKIKPTCLGVGKPIPLPTTESAPDGFHIAISSYSVFRKSDGTFQLWIRRVNKADGISSLTQGVCPERSLQALAVEVVDAVGHSRPFTLTEFFDKVVALTGPTQ